MEAYTGFAQVYDTFMDNVPYEEWADYYKEILREHGIMDGIVLDLGCGTGSMTELLAEQGYDMIGVDNSEEMLDLAMEKRAASGQDILYLLQDMRKFELYGTVRAVINACDSVNYLTEPGDLVKVFSLVNNYLDPGGLFLFDFNTEYKYRELLGDTTIAENREECSFIWENYYDLQERINEYDLTIFVREGELYRKFEETHFQRGYTVSEVADALREAGLELVALYDDFTREEPGEDSARVCVVARECRKCCEVSR